MKEQDELMTGQPKSKGKNIKKVKKQRKRVTSAFFDDEADEGDESEDHHVLKKGKFILSIFNHKNSYFR